jgi:hypothetical protein
MGMNEGESKSKEELLRIAEEVVAGTRDAADLDRHAITLGESIEGDAAKKLFLEHLEREESQDLRLEEQVATAEALWRSLVNQGVQRGDIVRFEATFVALEPAALAAAQALVDAFNHPAWASEGWSARVSAPGGTAPIRVVVVTRPVAFDLEVLQELTKQMMATGNDCFCDLEGLKAS